VHLASVCDTHAVPLKQESPGHEQTRVSSLNSGLQPQAPIRQVLGKSPPPSQQDSVATVPPESVQPEADSSVGGDVGVVSTQSFPSQQCPSGQEQTRVSSILSGEHPHAPIRQVLGKSSIPSQHRDVVTVPPASVHLASVCDTHAVPLKQESPGHEQTRVSSLNSGLHPHGPGAQVGGKSSTPSQQLEVVTVPPESMQSADF